MDCHFVFDKSLTTFNRVPTFADAVCAEEVSHMAFSRSHLGRLLLLATEVGARFERDALDEDPAAWLVTPRRVFGGSNAIAACRDELPFLRAMVLHGLSLELDATDSEVDSVVDEPLDPCSGGLLDLPSGSETDGQPQLYTATLASDQPTYRCQVFQALVADGPAAVVDALERRLGAGMCQDAEIRRGFDGSHPICCANVAPAIAAVLEDIAGDPSSTLAEGLDIFIEHRFVN